MRHEQESLYDYGVSLRTTDPLNREFLGLFYGTRNPILNHFSLNCLNYSVMQLFYLLRFRKDESRNRQLENMLFHALALGACLSDTRSGLKRNLFLPYLKSFTDYDFFLRTMAINEPTTSFSPSPEEIRSFACSYQMFSRQSLKYLVPLKEDRLGAFISEFDFTGHFSGRLRRSLTKHSLRKSFMGDDFGWASTVQANDLDLTLLAFFSSCLLWPEGEDFLWWKKGILSILEAIGNVRLFPQKRPLTALEIEELLLESWKKCEHDSGLQAYDYASYNVFIYLDIADRWKKCEPQLNQATEFDKDGRKKFNEVFLSLYPDFVRQASRALSSSGGRKEVRRILDAIDFKEGERIWKKA